MLAGMTIHLCYFKALFAQIQLAHWNSGFVSIKSGIIAIYSGESLQKWESNAAPLSMLSHVHSKSRKALLEARKIGAEFFIVAACH